MGIICEICGSNDISKEDGAFVCNCCGIRYSLDDVRRMYSGDVSTSISTSLKNNLVLAKTAFAAGNFVDSETYSKKALEIDSESSEAWILKGESVLFQSIHSTARFSEGLADFSRGIACSLEDKKQQYIIHSNRVIKEVFVKMINDFENENNTGLVLSRFKDLVGLLHEIELFINQTESAFSFDAILSLLGEKAYRVAIRKLNQMTILGNCGDEYQSFSVNAIIQYLSELDDCTFLIEASISFCNDSDERLIEKYETIVYTQQLAIDALSWKSSFPCFLLGDNMDQEKYRSKLESYKLKIEKKSDLLNM